MVFPPGFFNIMKVQVKGNLSNIEDLCTLVTSQQKYASFNNVKNFKIASFLIQ